jgi:TRAP-type C4-dicarboxylate transport system substrate-binding protein
MQILQNLPAGVCLSTLSISVASIAAADTTTLRVASYAPPGNFVNVDLISGFFDRVVADSEGTLDYQLFEGGTLGRSPVEQLNLVQTGIADVAFVLPSFTPGDLDLYGVPEIPGLFSDALEASLVIEQAHAAGVLSDPEGTKLLCLMTTDINIIGLSDAIETLEDLDGLRLRVVGKPQASAVELLGAVPTDGISSPEVAEAASRGTVDGTVQGAGSIAAYRVGEALDHYIRLPVGMTTLMLPMNLDTWNDLPAPAQAAFEKHGGANCAEFAGTIFRDTDEVFYNDLSSMEGRSATEVDEAMLEGFKELVAPIGEEWAARGDDFRATFDFVVEALEAQSAE